MTSEMIVSASVLALMKHCVQICMDSECWYVPFFRELVIASLTASGSISDSHMHVKSTNLRHSISEKTYHR